MVHCALILSLPKGVYAPYELKPAIDWLVVELDHA